MNGKPKKPLRSQDRFGVGLLGRAAFDRSGFLGAARALAAERGPTAVIVDLVTQRLHAPKGSFYHRFGSHDALMGARWLETVLAYQAGFGAAIEAGDGPRRRPTHA